MSKPVKIIYRLLAWFFSVLIAGSLAGCFKPMYGVPGPYHTPLDSGTKITIKGKVVRKEGDPLKGIKVVVPTTAEDHSAIEEDTLGETFTNEDGTYTIELKSSLKSAEVQASDVDGKENGGEYKTIDTQVDLSGSDIDKVDFEMELK